MNPSNDKDLPEILAAVRSVTKPAAVPKFVLQEGCLTTPMAGDLHYYSAESDTIALVSGCPTIFGMLTDKVEPKLDYPMQLIGDLPVGKTLKDFSQFTDGYCQGLADVINVASQLFPADSTAGVHVTVSLDLQSLHNPTQSEGARVSFCCFGVISVPCSREIFMSALKMQMEAGAAAQRIMHRIGVEAMQEVAQQNPETDPFAMSPPEDQAPDLSAETKVTEQGFMAGGLADLASRRLPH